MMSASSRSPIRNKHECVKGVIQNGCLPLTLNCSRSKWFDVPNECDASGSNRSADRRFERVGLVKES